MQSVSKVFLAIHRTMNTTSLCRYVLATAAALALALPPSAQSQDLSWLVRVRAVNLDSANKDPTGLDLFINEKVLPELDISDFFTPQLAAQLVLTCPQKQTIRCGSTGIGSLHHLPPTLSLQYHFTSLGAVKPYLCAGVNHTRLPNVSFSPAVVAALHPSLSENSFGVSLQAGADWAVTKSDYLNVDVKKVQIRTDISSSGTKVGALEVDPGLIGIGIGRRF